ncbi:hypothetical protein P3339_18355 [Microbulbifer sp. MLAF003]|uniref:hypothetical protein n=1 Tax=Microbulbifer TaxID=48073 RepID=UPI0003A6B8CF|nr:MULTISPECIES: hypothetical protein [Microbulbifer]WHI50386.1 hypothetical protein P3339_18355 [Microbulbifer sp. MLAF003]
MKKAGNANAFQSVGWRPKRYSVLQWIVSGKNELLKRQMPLVKAAFGGDSY